MSLSDAVIGAVVFQNVAGEDWLGVVGGNAGRGNGVCGFDVAVSMIHGNDFDVSQFLLKMIDGHKNSPPSSRFAICPAPVLKIWYCFDCKLILLKRGQKHIERRLTGN